MRNLYKGHTGRPTSKLVYFRNVKSVANFVNLYGDLFYRPDKSCAKERSKTGFTVRYDDDGDICLYFTVFKEDWPGVVQGSKICKIYSGSEKYWRFQEEEC